MNIFFWLYLTFLLYTPGFPSVKPEEKCLVYRIILYRLYRFRLTDDDALTLWDTLVSGNVTQLYFVYFAMSNSTQKEVYYIYEGVSDAANITEKNSSFLFTLGYKF